jgi:hypothetical protein
MDVSSSKAPSKSLNYLIEANKVLFEVYKPILKALQTADPALLPFQDYICPTLPPAEHVDVRPPAYARPPGFRFD